MSPSEEIYNARADIYQVPVINGNKDDPRSVASKWIQKGSTVLDVGCACGDLGVYLKKELQCVVYGLEYNESSIEFAQMTGAYERISQIDLNHFSSADYGYENKCDVIVICDVLEHLLDPGKVLKQLQVYLKPSGVFLISLPNVTHASIKLLLLSNKIRYTKTGILDETHLHFFTWRSICDLLGKASLDISGIDIVTCGMNGGYPGDVLGYVADKRIVQGILRDDESYVYQYVLKVRNTGGPASFKRFASMVRQCFADRSSVIESLRLKDLKRSNALNPFTLRLRYAKLRGRMLSKTIMNRIVPSEKRRKKIADLAEKTHYLKQALRP